LDYEPLVEQKIEAGRQFLQDCSKKRRVVAACWVKESDLPSWYLFVALEGIGDMNKNDGLDIILAPFHGSQPGYLSSRYVRLVSETHPMVTEISMIYAKYPAPCDTWYRGPVFAGMGTDNVFIYAPQTLVKKAKPKRKPLRSSQSRRKATKPINT
jgi:hypothetical protein